MVKLVSVLVFFCVVSDLLILARPAYTQGIAVDTQLTSNAALLTYDFTVNYSGGVSSSLIEGVWQWCFYIQPGTVEPSDVVSPTGWQHVYDASSGLFTWFTEGPGGWAYGDFGDNVIVPGGSLSGFRLTTPLSPDYNLAYANDELFNTDIAIARLPVIAPMSVPEGNTPMFIGCLLAANGLIWLRCRIRGRYDDYQNTCVKLRGVQRSNRFLVSPLVTTDVPRKVQKRIWLWTISSNTH